MKHSALAELVAEYNAIHAKPRLEIFEVSSGEDKYTYDFLVSIITDGVSGLKNVPVRMVASKYEYEMDLMPERLMRLVNDMWYGSHRR